MYEYLKQAITYIEDNAYYLSRVDNWAYHKAQALAKVADVSGYHDVYPIIRNLLNILDDKHSHLILPEQKRQEDNQDSAAKIPEGRRIDNIAYINLPAASGNDHAMQAYAETGQALFRDFYDVEAYILDLRDNHGGNMWAMLVAIGALIGEGTSGYFMGKDAQKNAWGYTNAASIYNGEAVYTVEDPVPIIDEAIPVAVLIDEHTASSGEIILIGLSTRPNLRSFGHPTRGIPTANDTFLLSDGALLVLTTAVCANRNGQIYEAAIQPDVITDNPLEEAKSWLKSQSSKRS